MDIRTTIRTADVIIKSINIKNREMNSIKERLSQSKEIQKKVVAKSK